LLLNVVPPERVELP